MKKTWIAMIISALIGLSMMVYGTVTSSDMLKYIVIFFIVGWGLALLRIGVNKAILSMKGKHIGIKILFFAVLLGFGLPFQSWFRKEIIMSMDAAFIVPCIITLVAGVVFFTMVYNIFVARFVKKTKGN